MPVAGQKIAMHISRRAVAGPLEMCPDQGALPARLVVRLASTGPAWAEIFQPGGGSSGFQRHNDRMVGWKGEEQRPCVLGQKSFLWQAKCSKVKLVRVTPNNAARGRRWSRVGGSCPH